ncbi:MAG: SUMF1/EgtB/PvdO family nonheme iron enzyme [Planctomycetota bacterium]
MEGRSEEQLAQPRICSEKRPLGRLRGKDSVAFCKWLSASEAKTDNYLPIEAEWEHACRAGTTTLWSFGDVPSRLANHAWYSDNSAAQLRSVGEKKPSGWGASRHARKHA